MDVFSSFWSISLIEMANISNIRYFYFLSDYNFYFNNFYFDFNYFYYSDFYIYKSIFLLGYQFHLDMLNFLIFSQIKSDFYDWFNICLIYYDKFLFDFNDILSYQLWYSNLCVKATFWYFYKFYKIHDHNFYSDLPFTWCRDCNDMHRHIYRNLWFYFLHDDLVINHRISLDWNFTNKYGPLRSFYIYKKGWTPYHIYYFFNFNNDLKYNLFWNYNILYVDKYYEFISNISYKILVSYGEEWKDPSSLFNKRFDLFWSPYLSFNYLFLLINKEPILSFIYFVLYIHWTFWNYILLFILLFLLIRLPFILIKYLFKFLLVPLNFDKFVENIRLQHNDNKSASFIYRLLTFYELKNSTFKSFLYIHRIQKLEILMKTRFRDYSNYYKFIIRTDFFISFIYLRVLMFDLWRVFIRFLYFIFVLPFIFLYKLFFKLFFFYFDVLGLISFLVYYINYILFELYNNINNNIYINLLKVLLYIKNLIAYATFFDSHFALMRSIYFWFPKKFHFHDPMIYDKAYPSLNHPWFARICNLIYPMYFATINFAFINIKNYIVTFFIFIQLSFIFPFYKFIKYFILFIIRKKNFVLSYYIYNSQLFIIFYNFFFEWFFNINIFIILFLLFYFYKFIFVIFVIITLFYFILLIIFNKFIYFLKYISLDYVFFILGYIFCSFFSISKKILNLIFLVFFKIFLKLPIIFIIFIFYFIFNFNWIFIFEFFNKLFFNFVLDFLLIKLNFIDFINLDLILCFDWFDYMLNLTEYIKIYNYYFIQENYLYKKLFDYIYFGDLWQYVDRTFFKWFYSSLRLRFYKSQGEFFFLLFHI